jgi:hypothetical protein
MAIRKPSHPEGSQNENNNKGVDCRFPWDLLSRVKLHVGNGLLRLWEGADVTQKVQIVKCCVGAVIYVNQVGWNCRRWKWVVKHFGLGSKDIPVGLTYLVLTFPAINSGNVKRAMDVCICVSKIEEATEWKELVALSISFWCVGRAYEVHIRWRAWPWQIVLAMVLQPEALIDCIVPEIRRVSYI